jgi:hypothetical protein
MAILTSGIMGPVTGKLGNLYYRWFGSGGQQIYSRYRRDVKSPAQLAIRTRFKRIMSIGRALYAPFLYGHFIRQNIFYNAIDQYVRDNLMYDYDWDGVPHIPILPGNLPTLYRMSVVYRPINSCYYLQWSYRPTDHWTADDVIWFFFLLRPCGHVLLHRPMPCLGPREFLLSRYDLSKTQGGFLTPLILRGPGNTPDLRSGHHAPWYEGPLDPSVW